MADSRSYVVYSYADNGQSAAEVTHAMFGRQLMGWVITRNGSTAAVSNDQEFCERLNALEAFIELLKQMDFNWQWSERHDQGYIDVSDEEWERLVVIMQRLGLRKIRAAVAEESK